ncbi:MAG TPA: UvrB/UvrC motif-containing protein [Acidobacteriaceae bacterium]|nr:UvrB/UvrC motif-containing protein [Acidobacteriaceae bacterium]
MFSHSVQFDPAHPAWADLPTQCAVFALFGPDPNAEPYISRTPNLRNRLRRLLDPRPDQSKRLRLAQSVTRIEYALTGSEFEAWLLLYAASLAAFGDRARKRLHLRNPVLLRMSMENAYPRVYVTNRVTKKAYEHLFGPWPSRVAAENALEAMLNLFLLRRCVDELHPDPTFPGCVYSEMKKCLAPCFKGCSDQRYAEEATAVHAFLATHGQSLIDDLAHQRDEASTALDFERAAELHARLSKVESAAALMPPAVHSLDHLSGLIIQPAAEPDQVALFLLTRGTIAGPIPYSVAGMRLHNEQSGSSSLFAQPVAIQPVPLDEAGAPAVKLAARDELESRLDEALTALKAMAGTPFVSGFVSGHGEEGFVSGHGFSRAENPPLKRGALAPGSLFPSPKGTQQTADHLSLFARWYYRPQAKRIGEVCFTQPDGELPKKAILRAISRVYRQSLPPAEPSSTGTSATSGPSGQSSA